MGPKTASWGRSDLMAKWKTQVTIEDVNVQCVDGAKLRPFHGIGAYVAVCRRHATLRCRTVRSSCAKPTRSSWNWER